MLKRLFLSRSRVSGSRGPVYLRLQERFARDKDLGITEAWDYNIHLPGLRQAVGYVSLRLGESPALYYLGHIGYRVYEPYRGQGLAARAVQALLPMMRELGLKSVVITTDLDNMPSIKTCQNLGCILESSVPVPFAYRAICMGSPAKHRFIYFVDEENINENSG